MSNYYSESSLHSSSVSFSLKQINNSAVINNNSSSLSTIPSLSQQNCITMKGECVIDLNYFQFFKQTYKASSHPLNSLFKVFSTKKSKHFVELCIQNQQKIAKMANSEICHQLQSVCPSKVAKATQLYDTLNNQYNSDIFESSQVQDQQSFQESTEKIQNEAFLNAASILNQRAGKLFKFNIFTKTEDNQINYLKTGMSTKALSALKMSADYYQYVHLRFGMSPFVDRFYSKNFFEINQRLLEQPLCLNVNEVQLKYVMNLSSVGAIYTLTESELLELNDGYFIEIQYYSDESILQNQVVEINKRLRVQAKEFQYSQASSSFINKYYPNAKTWESSNIQEVDSDIIERMIKKRELAMHHSPKQFMSLPNQECASKSLHAESNCSQFTY